MTDTDWEATEILEDYYRAIANQGRQVASRGGNLTIAFGDNWRDRRDLTFFGLYDQTGLAGEDSGCSRGEYAGLCYFDHGVMRKI